MVETSGLPARRACLRMLDAVSRRGDTLDVAFEQATRNLRPADAGLARAIASEVLRWLVDLDNAIDSVTRQPLAPDAKARMVLRMMLAQAWRLGSPAHAIVATGLPLLTGGPRRLTHGVFSTLMKRPSALGATPTLPAEVQARWQDAWPGRLPFIAAALAEPPPLDLTLREFAQTADWAARLDASVLDEGHLRLARGRNVTDLPGYAEGAWWVQDIAASIPARLLGSGKGRSVLDLCAAPGGKTMQLCAAGWKVTALDSSARRLALLKDNLRRTGLAAHTIQADARDWAPPLDDDRQSHGGFDAILLDAPCTATGTCRRHPDVLHRISSRQIADQTLLQADLLTRARQWLAPEGTLVYAVCSLEPEEGEQQAQACVSPDLDQGLVTDPIRAEELPFGLEPDDQGWVRTDPGMLSEPGGMDGFFIARFKPG
ncbi:methyltransferase domain-containing protein [Croceicoccus sp. F390]|uniref:Methyltransferase domain-containing protein n=1 Tax=Croceicoccus esteveae TaxID=3075597 RepID=A0ABU2ZIS3_9SPHN|nr:transcription antitermination factor NusB [Croceicoccus sp. F390]MDT0576508.1 methyltransferase domain-containing protein [Croceicoccus sp. F390]